MIMETGRWGDGWGERGRDRRIGRRWAGQRDVK